ncbi:MAG: hypothetical protein COT81_04385 [Candidatus Buchananbacteria bacterium CG10_big_fil_rev_8_21_14_0_10_42_9]|uniref:TrbC/VIRB2 family protein n=1 Tax=Candidatus Buchananbacteria bacterium CG10_big_fil_rev_8_21_14_0_10_42_9 TaxID=1974526 RepID=A0A2H0W0J0_9BACT|nr:MAG: hypothetical protein COT81_04385 [Candidatus Buchananbacteria bacterium CG10_big_fil_rev_8_21_14_0_10_42_9]
MTGWQKKLLLLGLAVLSFSFMQPAFASHGLIHDIKEELEPIGVNAYGIQEGDAEEDPRVVAIQVVRVFFSILGVVFIILLIWAGFTWMTSAGDEDKIATAKKTISAAVIGLIIIFVSYALATFILDTIICGTTGSC